MLPNYEKRKRKRSDGGSSSAIEYPNIPGVPMEVIPSFVHGLQSATKFFQRATTVTIADSSRNHNKTQNERSSPPESTSVMERLMDRVDSSAAASNSSELTQQEERKHRMEVALEHWLDSVKKFVKMDNRKRNLPEEDRIATSTATSERPSVPYSCFVYLWGLQQDHERMAVRRAALYLMGVLLQKSRDCRCYLDQDTHLATWVCNIVAVEEHVVWKNADHAASQIALYQQEAEYLLQSLVEQGYGHIYPKIFVALQRLRQQCPNLQGNSPASSSSMVDWRRLRDLALEHGQEEIRRVTKLVERAHACLDIIVPRLGNGQIGLVKESEIAQHEGIDEDDVDWEEGDKFDDGDLVDYASHATAVERTLAVMTSSGGLRGGELEINFGNANDDEPPLPTDEARSNQLARTMARLEKCVGFLANRHMPRITAWVEGLTLADNLVFAASSLVLLPTNLAQQRLEILEALHESKRVIASVLAAAQKLQLPVQSKAPGCSDDSRNPAPNPNLGTTVSSFTSALRRSRHPTTASSSRRGHANRIQIKYHPTNK